MQENVASSRIVHTFRAHLDYAKCLAYAANANKVASGGLDHCIHLWDLEKAVASAQYESEECSRQKNSIYALSLSSDAHLLVSGSTDAVQFFFTCNKLDCASF